jgi:hypothetical protein
LQKVISILIILVFCTQCSVSRKGKSKSKEFGIPLKSGSILQSIEEQNITKKSFFIDKAEFRIISGMGEKTGMCTIKFMPPDKFLVSIKSKAGIEIARVYLNKDSVMLNDRFNKKLYYGSASDLKTKYGLTAAVLPVILGDYINEETVDEKKLECINGTIGLDAVIKGTKIQYRIDCKYAKCILAAPENERNSIGLKIEYSSFFESGGINIPGRIDISEKQNGTRIEIKILKIVIPWEGSIEFIPGRQYEKIHLL